MKKRILILCTGNSCRSQMAEGFFKSFDENIEVFSAGVRPEKEVNPNAIKVMKEIGIDISENSPTNAEIYIDMPFDYVITVCDNAKETCPIFTGDVKEKVHIGFEDPAAATGTDEEVLGVYRRVRDEIGEEMEVFYDKNLKS